LTLHILNMGEVSTFILSAVTTYGLPMAGVVLFIGALGVPLPCTFIVIMLGAFARENIFNVSVTALLALASCVAGDLVIFGIGRWGRSWIPSRIQRSARLTQIEEAFSRRAGFAVFMTRWFVTPLSFPVSIIAGNSEYSFWKFLSVDILGQAAWIAIFGGLGYMFSSQSDLISEVFSSITGLIVGVVLVLIGAYALFKLSTLRLRRVQRT